MTIIRERGKQPEKAFTTGAEVTTEDVKVEDVKVDETPDAGSETVELKKFEEFTDKNELEAYGKEFDIDLKKNKTLANMYADLVAHVNKSE